MTRQEFEAFIDKPEVARRLNKTLRTVDNWMQRGLIPYFKIGRSVSFKWSDVETHLSQTCRVCRRFNGRGETRSGNRRTGQLIQTTREK